MMFEYRQRIKAAGIRCGEGADWDSIYLDGQDQIDESSSGDKKESEKDDS